MTNPLCAEKVVDGIAQADDWDCIDPSSQIAKYAMRVCSECPMQAECWTRARRIKAWGVWGGTVWRDGLAVRSHR